MYRIETKQDMIQWATEINNGLGTMDMATKCNYQDVWGHSEYNTVKNLFCSLNGERALIAQSIFNVMGYDALEDMVRNLAKSKAQQIIDDEMNYYNKEYEARDKALSSREAALKDSLKTYWKRITSLKETIAALKTKNDALIQRNEELHKVNASHHAKIAENQFKADSYDTIKRLLA